MSTSNLPVDGVYVPELHADRFGDGTTSVPAAKLLAAAELGSSLSNYALKTELEAENAARTNADAALQAQINEKAGTTLATASANGLMSKEDKVRLDGLPANGGLPTGGNANDILGRNASGAAWKTPAALANSLPMMSATQFGVARLGTGLAIDAQGILRATGGGTGGSGVTDHSDLTGRADPDQHPQSAIENLVPDLAALGNRIGAAETTLTTKADASALAAKADAVAVTNALTSKADASALAAKADADATTTALAQKATVAALEAEATTRSGADANLQGQITTLSNKITYGTADLTAGSSALATGNVYLVYE